MSSDIKLDGDGDGWVTVESNVLKTTSSDFMIDCPPRHKGSSAYRRALVHNEDDGLTVNFGRDYPGGVTVEGALTVEGTLTTETVHAGTVRIDAVTGELPRSGTVGEIILLRNPHIEPAALFDDVSLWMCVGQQFVSGLGGDEVYWQQISVGGPVAGTAG